MLKLQTPVDAGQSRIGISYKDRIMILGSCFADNIGRKMSDLGFNVCVKDRIMILGSCFADNIGRKMSDLGFNVCVNPFGTLYNPVSVSNSIQSLECGIPFSEDDCIRMGSGSPLICSFSHHTSFARETADEFLENANARLAEASEFYRDCNKVIITLGTSWCFRHTESGLIVSNCLKRDAKEFTRIRLDLQSETTILKSILEKAPEKKFIFTVSPIRHLKDGAHGNQLSKATLLLAEDELCGMFPDRCEYFPAYEIMMDELFRAPDACRKRKGIPPVQAYRRQKEMTAIKKKFAERLFVSIFAVY